MPEDRLPKFHYRVDAGDEIVWVDAWWLAFARENGASDLTEEHVLGRSLWNFIEDDETRTLYQEIHQRVRDTGRPAILPFRCDSPHVDRHMRLTITRGPDRQLCYESVLLRVETRRQLPLLARHQPRSEAFLTLCSCCKKALIEPAGWLDLAEVVVRLRLLEQERVPRLRNVLCPDCACELRRLAHNGNVA
jgi:hypothetical protein